MNQVKYIIKINSTNYFLPFVMRPWEKFKFVACYVCTVLEGNFGNMEYVENWELSHIQAGAPSVYACITMNNSLNLSEL